MRNLFTFILILISIYTQCQESWIIDKNGCKVHNPYPRNREAVLWIGDCVDSLADGEGKLIWYLNGIKTKHIFEGTMVKGKTEGPGRYTLRDGSTLVGEFLNGFFYEGIRTEKVLGDTHIYIGKFTDNQLNGKGELIVKGVYSYKGEFKDGFKHGYGIEKHEDDEYFQGEFDDGYYKKGKFVSNKHRYILESADWKYFSAKTGKITFFDSAVYIGEVKHSMAHGFGKMTFENGDIYEGEWKSNAPHGKGKYTFTDGIVYIAKWSDGITYGRGKIIYPDGKESIGFWKNDILVEEKTAPNTR